MKGRVYLVGAGPGDPGLLTLRALEVIKGADVVIHDRLVSDAVLDLIPRRVKRTYGGKSPGSAGEEQERLNELMLEEARAGKKVARLKGGDPFLFSRGGEEAEFLRANGIEFEVVPGVTSALAVPAYAGIPTTHRDHSSAVAIVTGTRSSEKGPRTDWARFAGSDVTLVVLMGAAKLAEISEELLKAGLAKTTPVAVVSHGTTAKQATVLMTLEEAASGEGSPAKPPSVMIVGDVASLASTLSWRAGKVTETPGYAEAWRKRKR